MISVGLSADSPVRLSQGKTSMPAATPISIQAPEMTFCFTAPARLQVAGAARLDTDLPIDAGIVGSSLAGASLDLPDADKTLSLGEDEGLQITNDDAVTRLGLGQAGVPNNLLEVQAQGSVKEVLTGVPGRLRTQSPRLIWFLQAKDALGGLLAAVCAAWSVAWGAINLTRPAKETG
jgi:hypothetical protein